MDLNCVGVSIRIHVGNDLLPPYSVMEAALCCFLLQEHPEQSTVLFYVLCETSLCS